MKRFHRVLAGALALAMSAALAFTGCSNSSKPSETKGETQKATEDAKTETDAPETEAPEVGDNFIELAMHVLYNDTETACYEDVPSKPIIVTSEGQYTLTFDCNEDLPVAVTSLGIKTLTNLTAIYIKDEGIAKGEQSPLKAATITYDSIKVDDTELTITKAEPKSAFKASGQFDTNDPVNAWDGSAIEEIDCDEANHIANFSSVKNPTKMEITFTLSDLDWTGESASGDDSNTPVADGANTAVFSDIDFTDVTAVQLTEYLGNGINLGNTMEATVAARSPQIKATSVETAWGQPVTTAAMIQGMKNAGFDTIRIPVSWTSTMDIDNKDYTISDDFMNRVQEIVDYAIDAEMFVIVNDHWDYGWWAMFGSSEEEDVAQAWDIYTAMWTQVAEHFKDYSDMLIFESANEELGNSLDNNGNWANSGYLKTAENKYKMTNDINQKFVDVVRAAGGNNDDRFLLIAGYNTNIDDTLKDLYVMPTDSAKDKLFVSVHYYDPASYCLAGDAGNIAGQWGIKSDYEYMKNQVSKMAEFVKNGYGVIIGEYAAIPGAVDGVKTMQPGTIEYTKFMLDVCDVNNFCPVLWSKDDLYEKSNLAMMTTELQDLYISRCYAAQSEYDYITAAETEMDTMMADAPDQWEGVLDVEDGTPVAYIMWNGGAGSYNVGDKYEPGSVGAGLTPHDVIIDGAGTYTVGIDFATPNDGVTFAALALNAGEDNYGEGKVILDIKEITVNGEPMSLIADPYTASDDGHCTRVNLINEWVSAAPDDARTVTGDVSNVSPVIIDKTLFTGMNDIYITFDVIINE